MSLVENPQAKQKLIWIALLDGFLTFAGVAVYLVTENLLYLIVALILGAAISVPLLLQAMRDMKEQN